MKKQSMGWILSVITVLAAVVGLAGYLINCNTRYFVNLGIDPVVVAAVALGLAAEVAYVLVNRKGTKVWADILAVAVPVLLMVGTLLFVNSRVNSIAAVMTFENNAQNMADLTSCIVGILGCLVAAIVSIVGAFHDVTGE